MPSNLRLCWQNPAGRRAWKGLCPLQRAVSVWRRTPRSHHPRPEEGRPEVEEDRACRPPPAHEPLGQPHPAPQMPSLPPARSLPAALEVALLALVGKASPPPILWLQGSLLCAPSLWSQFFTPDRREPSRLPGFMSLPHSRWMVPGTKHLFCKRVWAAFNKSSLC